VSADGALDGRLPNLHIPGNSTDGEELLAAHRIAGWVDSRVNDGSDPLEGFKDGSCKDESHAWVTLLEENVHAALLLAQPRAASLLPLSPDAIVGRPIGTFLHPPPAPLSGLGSLLPPYGTRVPTSTVELQYREAISSLSQRLGTDTWFLGSNAPTALDALLFAYLHSILREKDNIRIEVTRRVNLVAWELRVRSQVQAAFVHGSK
jgi:metaxin